MASKANQPQSNCSVCDSGPWLLDQLEVCERCGLWAGPCCLDELTAGPNTITVCVDCVESDEEQ